MKVVIFCGGLGVRMGEATKSIPKPMITVGNRPMLWHIMRWYAAWGHTEFVLCLGYKGGVHQAVLPRLQRGALERLRPLERRRATSSSSRATSPIGRSRSSTPARSRRSPSGCWRSQPHLGRRRVLPRHLRRRTDGCAAAGHDRRLESSGQERPLPLGTPDVQLRTSSAPTRTGRFARVDDIQEADIWINGGFFVFRRTSSTTSTRARNS